VPHLKLDHVGRAELFDERQPCQLGSGNSGETFLGSYRGHLVAVKVAKPEQSAHKVLHKELQTWKHVLRSLTARELRLFARPVAGGTLEGGETFLATELIDGETVKDWQLAWPPEALGDIMHALELLHEYAAWAMHARATTRKLFK
jgi:predicted Ser/Thr protein kinase